MKGAQRSAHTRAQDEPLAAPTAAARTLSTQKVRRETAITIKPARAQHELLNIKNIAHSVER